MLARSGLVQSVATLLAVLLQAFAPSCGHADPAAAHDTLNTVVPWDQGGLLPHARRSTHVFGCSGQLERRV